MRTKSIKINNVIPQELIENKILFIRGRKVMIDRDLSILYRVETRVLNQAVKRNLEALSRRFYVSTNRW